MYDHMLSIYILIISESFKLIRLLSMYVLERDRTFDHTRYNKFCPSHVQRFMKFCWEVLEKLRWQTSFVVYLILISKLKNSITHRKICTQYVSSLLHSFIKLRWAVSDELRSQSNWVACVILARFLAIIYKNPSSRYSQCQTLL